MKSKSIFFKNFEIYISRYKSFKNRHVFSFLQQTVKHLVLTDVRMTCFCQMFYNFKLLSQLSDIFKNESVQRNFTRLACKRCNISNTSYKERLVKLGLKSLEYRSWQFDLITSLKIINGNYKEFFNKIFVFSLTN